MDYDSSSLYAGNAAQRITGFILFLALAWFAILKPAIFGLRQALGQVDPLTEAMAGVRKGLRGVFGDILSLARASLPDQLAMVACNAIEDLFGGRATGAARDAAILIARAKTTYGEYQDIWALSMENLEGCSTRELIATVHGFLTWLQSPEVLQVLQAAGRRFGMGEDVAEDRRSKLIVLAATSAPGLAHGFWYGLYATVVFQLLVLEVFYVWGHPRPLFWTACSLIVYNVTKGGTLLCDVARIWQVRMEVDSIAAAIGIPNLPKFAMRLLAEQVLGVITMLLLVICFLALGEALHQPGNILSGMHQAIVWTREFYLEMARIVMLGLSIQPAQ